MDGREGGGVIGAGVRVGMEGEERGRERERDGKRGREGGVGRLGDMARMPTRSVGVFLRTECNKGQ